MALRLEGLTRRFGSQLALDAVSLHVRRGDCYGFLGPNGAGKTTTLRIALGLETPDAGRVLVEGFDAREHPREARARMGGLVETPGFHGHLDGAANLALLARLQGMDGAAARRETARVLDLVGLASAGGKPVRAYSQGMRQRLGIAQALLGSPLVVLLDEPMNGLDPEGIEETRRLLHRLTRDEGMTVLFSSHQLAEIASVCTRIGILRQGRLLVEEETARLLAAEAGRYALATDDDASAARLLASRGIVARPNPAGGLDVALGAHDAAEAAAALVAAGARLRAWTPRPASLEEIYLRFIQGERQGAAAPAKESPAPPREPAERRAPSNPIGRMQAHELRRWLATPAIPLAFALPAAVAAGSVASRHASASAHAKDVASGALATTTSVTGFEAFGVALQTSLPLLLVLVAALASQSLAGELARGTLRNVALRPMRRLDVAAGKFAAVLVVGLLAAALLAGVALLASGQAFGFCDVTEVLPNGRSMVLPGGEAAAMWPALWRTLGLAVVPLAAFAALGLLCGALTRSGVAALAAVLGAAGLLEAARAVFERTGAEGWLLSAHVPAPFARDDPSPFEHFVRTTRLMTDAIDRHGDLHVVAPLVWTAAAFALAVLLFRRRSIR